jgi:hypothetical protein
LSKVSYIYADDRITYLQVLQRWYRFICRDTQTIVRFNKQPAKFSNDASATTDMCIASVIVSRLRRGLVLAWNSNWKTKTARYEEWILVFCHRLHRSLQKTLSRERWIITRYSLKMRSPLSITYDNYAMFSNLCMLLWRHNHCDTILGIKRNLHSHCNTRLQFRARLLSDRSRQ